MRKGEATRLRVIDEAARQAAFKGLAGVSLGDVAEAVGPLTAYASRGRELSKGSLAACNANAQAKASSAETAQK